jgi:predicted ATP-grasp superfamily ATP-dependent carboligase
MTALLTCGQTRSALAATRSLGRAGEAVAVGAPRRPALAMWSRFATSTFLLPDPATDARLFATQVGDQAHGRRARVVLAGTTGGIWALSKWRELLPEGVRRVLPPHDALARAHDRGALFDLAGSLGIGALETIRIQSVDEVEPALRRARQLGLPAMVRPLVSHLEREGRSLRRKDGISVGRIRDLRRLLYRRPDLAENGCIIEPRPAGQTLGYGAICEAGQPVVEIFQERLRERRMISGMSTWAQTIEIDPEVRRAGRTLLEALGWQGPAMIEFLRTESEGALRLVGVFGRLWNSVRLAIKAGVDVPLLLLRMAEGETLPSGRVASPGVRYRWLIGDLQQAAMAAGRVDAVDGGLGLIARARSIGQFVDPRGWAHVSTDVYDRDDPMPFLFELRGLSREVR